MAGGANWSGASVPTSEVYLPLAHQWIGTDAMFMSRAFHIGVGLSDGRVLVAGGCNPQTCIPFAEVFSPARLPADSRRRRRRRPAGDGGGQRRRRRGANAESDPRRSDLASPAALPHGSGHLRDGHGPGSQVPGGGWELQDGDFQPNPRP